MIDIIVFVFCCLSFLTAFLLVSRYFILRENNRLRKTISLQTMMLNNMLHSIIVKYNMSDEEVFALMDSIMSNSAMAYTIVESQKESEEKE